MYSFFFLPSEQNVQAKKNAPNPLSIKVFQKFQAIIKRILEQTKKPQAIACGERTILCLCFYFEQHPDIALDIL